uniref:Uncharacterized protein n=1 Tax=Arundo donax TaxID=35708 RepID=A0A0A9DZN6_ARUDO
MCITLLYKLKGGKCCIHWVTLTPSCESKKNSIMWCSFC